MFMRGADGLKALALQVTERGLLFEFGCSRSDKMRLRIDIDDVVNACLLKNAVQRRKDHCYFHIRHTGELVEEGLQIGRAVDAKFAIDEHGQDVHVERVLVPFLRGRGNITGLSVHVYH